MNFFKEQARAQQKTNFLVVLIVLGFAASAIAINALVIGIWYLVLYFQFGAARHFIDRQDIFGSYILPATPYVCAITTLIFLLISFVSSWLKYRQIKKGGGHYVAMILGGRMVLYESATRKERQLLNIVEEMAIASGLSVPAVYLMDQEEGINAFAAGFTPRDTVVAVTRGCLDKLDREALQGVVAHEFSHILHGDVRLNLRLVGLMHGLLVIGLTGFVIMRLVFMPRASVRSYRKKDQGGPYLIAVFILGLGLAIVGYVGHFFGVLIRAAVSRQREYLADASAVQFTRDPDTIGKALKLIAKESVGTKLNAPDASEYSHTYFAQGVTNWLGQLTATHPSLRSRIKAIDPGWDGNLDAIHHKKAKVKEEKPEQKEAKLKTLAAVFTPQMLLAEVGNLTWNYVLAVHADIKELPQHLVRFSHCAYESRAVVYALLSSKNEKTATLQWERVQGSMDPKVQEIFTEVKKQIKDLNRNQRLSLANLSLTGLRQLSKKQFQQFKENCKKMVAHDRTRDIFEWCLAQVVLAPLECQFNENIRSRETSIASASHHVQYLLNVLGEYGETKRESLFKVCESLDISYMEIPSPDLGTLAASMPYLMNLKHEDKQKVLSASIIMVQHDGKVSEEEAQLLRAFCLIFGCPMSHLKTSTAPL